MVWCIVGFVGLLLNSDSFDLGDSLPCFGVLMPLCCLVNLYLLAAGFMVWCSCWFVLFSGDVIRLFVLFDVYIVDYVMVF